MKLKTIFIIAIFSFLFISACKKEEITTVEKEPLITGEMINGLPGDQKKISGYLHASISKGSYYYLYLYAAFSEPASSLLTSYNHYSNNYWSISSKAAFGNIDVGEVSFNNNYILNSAPSKPTFLYHYNSPIMLPYPAPIWSTEGNKSFGAINLTIERGFPLMNLNPDSVALISMSGFTLDPKNIISNYDSLIVLIDDNLGSTPALRKNIGAINTPIVFSAEDFKNFWQGTTSGSIMIYAFNYSNKIVDNRMYVFELSNKFSQNIILSP